MAGYPGRLKWFSTPRSRRRKNSHGLEATLADPLRRGQRSDHRHDPAAGLLHLSCREAGVCQRQTHRGSERQSGSGYYTWKQRKFAISTFLFGFVILWVSMIFIGTFIRGPGWQWFWPGQTWDHNRLIYEV